MAFGRRKAALEAGCIGVEVYSSHDSLQNYSRFQDFKFILPSFWGERGEGCRGVEVYSVLNSVAKVFKISRFQDEFLIVFQVLYKTKTSIHSIHPIHPSY